MHPQASNSHEKEHPLLSLGQEEKKLEVLPGILVEHVEFLCWAKNKQMKEHVIGLEKEAWDNNKNIWHNHNIRKSQCNRI